MSAKDINASLGRRSFSDSDMLKMTSKVGLLARGITEAGVKKIILAANPNKLHSSITVNIHFPSFLNELQAEVAIYIGNSKIAINDFIVTEFDMTRRSTYSKVHKLSSDENFFVFSNVTGLVVRIEGYADGMY